MPFATFLNPETNTTTRTVIFSVAASASALICFIVVYICYSFILRSRANSAGSSSSKSVKKFSYKELKSATNGFADSSLIGKGGSGTVYLGVLNDGSSAAIKKIDASCLQSEREYQNELQILGNLIRSPFIVTLLGFCARRRSRYLVYEHVPNRSLQESLFSDGVKSDLNLTWERRFEVVLDVARALAHLHTVCDPPVIHGDVKPSNVLLDGELRAKLSDFGLSRLKTEEDEFPEFRVDFSPVLGPGGSGSSGEVDFALALQNSSRNSKLFSYSRNSDGDRTANGDCSGNVVSENEFAVDDVRSESGCNPVCGKDWWWKQEGSGELSRKDYVAEWIGSQISPKNSDWDDRKKCSPVPCQEVETRKQKRQKLIAWKVSRKEKQRKVREWWKEENLAEITKKSEKSKKNRRLGFRWRNSGGVAGEDDCGEFSFRIGWRKKSRNNIEMLSEELHSRELSSTTSMRGTLCYVAPEYGGSGDLMEKTDVYSFGVLVLVIVSGRRPLHILSSPMKLEKANLISWCRHLAHFGNVIELVDERLEVYDEEQARLCINLAVSCLQRSPECRPSMADSVEILTGKMDVPQAPPLGFTPSPPPRPVSRSRRRPMSGG